MRATEHTDRPGLDLDAIMHEGGRLRRRRRLAGTGAVALSVVLVVVGIAVGVRQFRPAPAPVAGPTVSPAAPTSGAPAATPTVTETTDKNRDETGRQPVGEVVTSGLRRAGEERVFYFVPVHLPDLPDVRIGLVAGRRTADGGLVSDFLANDVEGSDRRPGFHAIGNERTGQRDGPPLPIFGYFVGPAKRITATAGERRVDARVARWSADPQVLIFWFDPEELAPGVRLDGIIARDSQGRRL
ncbi:hypothetical protein GCM10027605_03730 [Micromonospora zhanjiangensis]